MKIGIALFKLLQFIHWLASAIEWRFDIRHGLALSKFGHHAALVASWAKSDLAAWKRLTFWEVRP